MRKLLLGVFLLLSLVTHAQYHTVETVPNTKLVNNSYVSNPDGILSESTVYQLNTILGKLEAESTAQVAVVMLTSIGGDDIFDFSQRLFTHWGIGQSETDNGLLILFVLDQRTIRFHTGYGIEGILPDIVCKHIQQEQMLPFFREEDYDKGMLTGIQQVAELLNNPEAANEFKRIAYRASDKTFGLLAFLIIACLIFGIINGGKEKFQPAGGKLVLRIPFAYWIFLYAIIPASVLLIGYYVALPTRSLLLLSYGCVIFLLIERYIRIQLTAAPFKKTFRYQELSAFYIHYKSEWKTAAIFFPIPILIIYLLYLRQIKQVRNGKRPCKKCGSIIHNKLSEKIEDEFLKPGQITEENIGTIDYDVWKCQQCNSVEVLNYPKLKTDYTRCPVCNHFTYHLGTRRTIQRATYEADGYGESIRNCLHCGHQHVDKFILAMLVASSSYDSSDSSSSSSSSSDSGGSWGGGDSGGGGSSSSW
jgi:uncharacterized protein